MSLLPDRLNQAVNKIEQDRATYTAEMSDSAEAVKAINDFYDAKLRLARAKFWRERASAQAQKEQPITICK